MNIARATIGPRLLLAVCAILTIPPPPGSLGAGLDPSFLYGVNMAWNRGMTHGRDFVFTYGPLSWLLFPDPDLVPRWPVLAYSWLTYAAGLVFLWKTALAQRWELRLCAAVWTAAIAMWLHPVDRLQFTVIATMILFVLLRTSASGLAAACAAGLALVVKANDGIVAVAVLAAAVILTPVRDGVRWSRIAMLASPFCIAAAVVGPRALPGYLRWAVELSSGYSEAMGIGGPMWQFVAGAAGLVALALLSVAGRNPLLRLAPAAPCLLVAFGAWKHAMVRHDAHADPLHVKLGVAAILLAAVAEPRRARFAAAYAAVSVVAGAMVLYYAGGQRLPSPRLRDAAAAWADFGSYWEWIRQANRSALQTRALPPAVLDAVRGHTVEAVPYSIDLIRAAGLDWRPRPVVQTYSAYTPSLDSLNASHVAGPRAASRVLLEEGRVDSRHILLDDARSMRALVDHYDPVDVAGPVVVLARRAAPRFGQVVDLTSSTAAWGELTPVPAAPKGSRRIASIRVRLSPWGRLRKLLFRTTPVFVEQWFASGRVDTARILPRNLADGALFYGVPRGLAELARLFEPAGEEPDRLISMRLFTPGGREFDPQIQIEWKAVRERDVPSGSPPR